MAGRAYGFALSVRVRLTTVPGTFAVSSGRCAFGPSVHRTLVRPSASLRPRVGVTLPLLAYLVAIPGTQLGAGAAISMMMMPAYIILVIFLTRAMLQQE